MAALPVPEPRWPLPSCRPRCRRRLGVDLWTCLGLATGHFPTVARHRAFCWSRVTAGLFGLGAHAVSGGLILAELAVRVFGALVVVPGRITGSIAEIYGINKFRKDGDGDTLAEC
jgi:hypothetical protein